MAWSVRQQTLLATRADSGGTPFAYHQKTSLMAVSHDPRSVANSRDGSVRRSAVRSRGPARFRVQLRAGRNAGNRNISRALSQGEGHRVQPCTAVNEQHTSERARRHVGGPFSGYTPCHSPSSGQYEACLCTAISHPRKRCLRPAGALRWRTHLRIQRPLDHLAGGCAQPYAACKHGSYFSVLLVRPPCD
jgi:hypothetical protein